MGSPSSGSGMGSVGMLIAVDASVNTEAAGIAIVSWPEGTLLGMEVCLITDVNLAEGLAVIRGLSFLAQRGARPDSKVLSDSETVGQIIQGKTKHPRLKELGVDLRAMIQAHGFGVEIVGRQQVQAAHNAANQAVKCWTHGKEGKPTWVRTPYVRIPEMLAE